MAAQSPQFQASFHKPDKQLEWQTLEYTVPELVRPGDSVQVDHPSGFRLLFALPPDAATGTKVMLSVPACSGEIPALTAVKAEDVKHGTLTGRCVRVDVRMLCLRGRWVCGLSGWSNGPTYKPTLRPAHPFRVLLVHPLHPSTFAPIHSFSQGMVGGIPTTSSTALKMVEWKENAEQPNCKVCNTEFGFTRWHHHCRRCGMNVCNACSSTRKCIPGYAKDQRVCDTCVQYEMSTLIGTN